MLLVRTAARGTLCLTLGGCMTLTPQLEPTDLARLERVESRQDRDAAFRDNSLYRHEEPQGTRYTKGNVDGTPKRSWQSLDAVLRSDENSSAALPVKHLRRSRVFTGLAIASSVLFVSGVAATARDGFSFREATPGNVILLGGALASVAFAVLAGVFFRRARTDYDRAVDIYNDSLGLRLGVMNSAGNYKPPSDVMIDEEGYVITEELGGPAVYGPAPAPGPGTAPAPGPGIAPMPGSEPMSQPMPPAPAPTSTSTSPSTLTSTSTSTSPSTSRPTPLVPAPAAVRPPGHARVSAPSGAPTAPPASLRRDAPRLPVGALTLLPQR